MRHPIFDTLFPMLLHFFHTYRRLLGRPMYVARHVAEQNLFPTPTTSHITQWTTSLTISIVTTTVMGRTQQRTNNTHLVEKNPFFMAGVVERTGTGRNNPCSASTTLLIIFSSPTFRTCSCRAFALQLGVRTVHLQHKYVQTPPHIVLLAWWQKQCEDHCLEHQGSPYA